jgi:hypothetical protein
MVDHLRCLLSSRHTTSRLLAGETLNRSLDSIEESLEYYEGVIRTLKIDLDFLSQIGPALSSYHDCFVAIKRLKYEDGNPDIFMYNHCSLKNFKAIQNCVELQAEIAKCRESIVGKALFDMIRKNKAIFEANLNLFSQAKTTMQFK